MAPRLRAASLALVAAVAVLAAPSLLAALAGVPLPAEAASNVSFSMEAIQGDRGTSFLYMRAHDTHPVSTPAPNRRLAGCPVPYYTEWSLVSRDATWSHYVIRPRRCSDGELVDPSHGYGMAIGNGDGTVVAGAQQLDASGVLIYTLAVSLTPNPVQSGQPATLSGQVTDDFVAVADRTLNISVRPDTWSAEWWLVEYGDGARENRPGGGRALSVNHVYAQAGTVNARLTAHVTGTAQVADFNPATGEPFLEDESFGINVTNSTAGDVSRTPVRAYVAPTIRLTAAATIAGRGSPSAAGSPTIEAFRGVLTDVYLRPEVVRPGYLTLDGAYAGDGTSQPLQWRLDAGGFGGPTAQVTAPGTWAPAAAPVVLQWDRPDPATASGPVAFVISMTYVIRTTYPDGHQQDSSHSVAIAVRVRYAASGGEG